MQVFARFAYSRCGGADLLCRTHAQTSPGPTCAALTRYMPRNEAPDKSWGDKAGLDSCFVQQLPRFAKQHVMTSHSPMWHICLAFKSLVPLAGPPCRQPPPHAKHCPCRGVWKLSTSAPKKPRRCSTSAPEAFGDANVATSQIRSNSRGRCTPRARERGNPGGITTFAHPGKPRACPDRPFWLLRDTRK